MNLSNNILFGCRTEKNLIILTFLCCFLVSCSKDGHIDIVLTDAHLEQTSAGYWLSTFGLSYSSDAKNIKEQILSRLRQNGSLLDKYEYEENSNKVETYLWNYAGYTIKEQWYKGGIWRGPKIYPPQEYYEGELAVWITIELNNRILYSHLLPNNYKQLNNNRKYEHTATIKSIKDKARLFLFGYGTTCSRISLY